MSLALRTAFEKIAKLTESEYDYITSHFNPKIIHKKEHVFVAGEICKLAVYCERGCFRKYFVNDRGDDIVVDFAVEDYWIGDLNSLINKVPTLYNFQALEDSLVQITPYSNWEKISSEIPEFRRERYAKENRNHSKSVEQLTIEKYATAEEKYERMMQRFPGITNRVAAIHIASYLGIKPESLSRLKKKFARKKS